MPEKSTLFTEYIFMYSLVNVASPADATLLIGGTTLHCSCQLESCYRIILKEESFIWEEGCGGKESSSHLGSSEGDFLRMQQLFVRMGLMILSLCRDECKENWV